MAPHAQSESGSPYCFSTQLLVFLTSLWLKWDKLSWITKKKNEIIIIINNKSANPFSLETQGNANTKIPNYKSSSL